MRVALFLILAACGVQNPPESDVTEDGSAEDSNAADVAQDTARDAAEADAIESDAIESDSVEADAVESDASGDGPQANVVAVEVVGDGLVVTIQSPDTGCTQYANWWEVVTEDGTLLYRRILGHSHVDEQPFTRSGGPVDSEQALIVRAHMAPGGYGGAAFRGTLSAGFSPAPDIDAGFASDLDEEAPLPSSCAF
jgi:hypothetical protein